MESSRIKAEALERAQEWVACAATLPHGPCWVCGTPATLDCDWDKTRQYKEPLCHRWCCDDHLIIEAQHWDRYGANGVDIRCSEHRRLSLDVRDW